MARGPGRPDRELRLNKSDKYVKVIFSGKIIADSVSAIREKRERVRRRIGKMQSIMEEGDLE